MHFNVKSFFVAFFVLIFFFASLSPKVPFVFLRWFFFVEEEKNAGQTVSLIFIVRMFHNHFVWVLLSCCTSFIPIWCCSSLQLRFSHNTHFYWIFFPSKSFSLNFFHVFCFFFCSLGILTQKWSLTQ